MTHTANGQTLDGGPARAPDSDKLGDGMPIHNDSDPDISPFQEFYCENKDRIKFGLLNVNSIRHKFVTLRHVLQKGMIDILFLQETKLDESFPSSQFNVDHFKVYRKDVTSSAGGLMCLIRSDLAHRRRVDLENSV